MKPTAVILASDVTMRLLLESTLSPQHWRVTQASSVAGAVMVLPLGVDLLMVDLTQLPRQDVLGLCRSTRVDPWHQQTKIIALANPEEAEKIGKDLLRQIDVLFQKPFSPLALLDWIYTNFPIEGQGPPWSSTGVA